MKPLQPVRRPRSGCWRCWPLATPRCRPLASSNLTNDPAGGSDKEKQARRRGRPAKSDQSEAEFVEWWKPGWRDRFGRNARQSSQVCEVPNQCNAVRKSCSITPGSAP